VILTTNPITFATLRTLAGWHLTRIWIRFYVDNAQRQQKLAATFGLEVFIVRLQRHFLPGVYSA